MSRGQLAKISGSICNIPTENAVDNYNVLPKPAYSNDLIIGKLKKSTVQRS